LILKFQNDLKSRRPPANASKTAPRAPAISAPPRPCHPRLQQGRNS